MVKTPTRSLGINRTIDASVAVIEGSSVSLVARKERLVRRKHARGAIGDAQLYRSLLGDKPFDVVVECYSSDLERQHRHLYREELRAELPMDTNVEILEISHHFSHALLAHLSGFTRAAVLVADHHGSPLSLIGPTPPVANEPSCCPVEVISTYLFEQQRLTPVAKQAWDMETESLRGLGAFYSLASERILGRPFREGVLTGLAAYGDAKRCRLPALNVTEVEVHVPEEWLSLLRDQQSVESYRYDLGHFQKAADLAAAVQVAFENALLSLSNNLRDQTGADALVYVGGCAMNCSANAELSERGPFRSIFTFPACDDGGSSVGCAIYGAQTKNENFASSWTTDYFGPPVHQEIAEILQKAKAAGHSVIHPVDVEIDVAMKLARGEVVAIWQGRSEIGARALGNRSIIADPRFDVARTFINSRIKGREWFRPLAPAVTAEAASEYFVDPGYSPYMLKRKLVRPEYRKYLQAVTHFDGTARVQTVHEEDNPQFHKLLNICKDYLSFPVVLNTSFNGSDEPIVESFSDALRTFARLPIHHLFASPFLISKRPLPPSMYVS